MDIGWAVKAMKNGEKVRRAVWAPMAQAYRDKAAEGVKVVGWDHLYLEWRPGHGPALMVRRGDWVNDHFVLTDDHLLADDWEIAG